MTLVVLKITTVLLELLICSLKDVCGGIYKCDKVCDIYLRNEITQYRFEPQEPSMPSCRRNWAICGIIFLIVVILISFIASKILNWGPHDEKRSIKFRKSKSEVVIYKEYTEKRIVMWLLKGSKHLDKIILR